LQLAGINRKLLVAILAALSTIAATAVGAQNAPPAASSKSAGMSVPKLWHSPATNHDFRVAVKDDVFTADWINVPPAAAKRGAFIHTECRRTGDGQKWVGASNIHMLFDIPGAPSGKDTKLCSLTVRFEIDSLTPEKIVGHSESLRAFDVNACQIQQTSWGNINWVPKK
jgi:hypothetical protein